MENENTENLSDDILTFDEILDDPYYKAEFDRRVQQALDIKNTHSEVKVSKARKPKQREKWKALLEKADEDIKFLPTNGNKIKLDACHHIKFMRVRISTIFSRVEKSDGDDEDLESNETKHVSELVFKKLLSVIALSVAFSTLFFQPGEFAVAILVSTFMKLFRTAMSISLGASDGQAFARGTLLSKMKLRLDFIQKFLEREKSKAGEKPLEAIEAAV